MTKRPVQRYNNDSNYSDVNFFISIGHWQKYKNRNSLYENNITLKSYSLPHSDLTCDFIEALPNYPGSVYCFTGVVRQGLRVRQISEETF